MRLLLLVGAIVAVIVVIWYENNISGRKTKILYSIWNKAQALKGKIAGVSVNLLDVIDDTNIPPKEAHAIVTKFANNKILVVSQHTVKFTKYGESYFNIKYLKK